MVDIPEDVVTVQDIADWYTTQAEISRLKQKEALQRSRIFKFHFKDPHEGTNDAPLNDGTGAVLKATYVINRTVEPGSLDALRTTIAVEGYNGPKLNLSDLIKFEPKVVISEYRKLTDEERNYFDQCLVIKPGTPQMEVVIPKRVKT